MSRTIAVVVGVSTTDETLPNLPGAAADARRVARSLVAHGVDPHDLALLVDSEATRASVLGRLRVWASKRAHADSRFIFFFSGHGVLIEDDARRQRSVLMASDATLEDPATTGIPLDEVIGAIGRWGPRELYLFIDACQQHLPNLRDPLVLDTEVASASTPRTRCLLCVLAAGAGEAYESTHRPQGEFTSILLQELARSSERSVTSLMRQLSREMQRRNLPEPRFYLIGSEADAWPLPGSTAPSALGDILQAPEIQRGEVHSLLSRSLSVAEGRPVWFQGESGSGKSTIVRHFVRSVGGAYASIEGQRTARGALESIAGALVDALPSVFPTGRPTIGDAVETLRKVSLVRPGTTVVLDHLERLPNAEVAEVVAVLGVLSIDAVVVSTNLPPGHADVLAVECPDLTDEEIECFRRAYGPANVMSPEAIGLLTKRQPLAVRSLLASGATALEQVVAASPAVGAREAASTLARVGGFVDASLFCRMFSIRIETLAWLSATGFVQFVDDHFEPHDALRELDSIPQPNQREVTRFWSAQVMDRPGHRWACERALASLAREATSEADSAACVAVQTLVRANQWSAIEQSLDATLSTPCVGAAILVAEEAAHIARHAVVNEVVTAASGWGAEISSGQHEDLRLALSEDMFWQGDFDGSFDVAMSVAARSQNQEQVGRALLNAAIARFFQGRWADAISYLGRIDDVSASPRTRAWRSMIEGTILALRGTHSERGTRLLCEARDMLDSIGDEVGCAIALNNLGEVEWKEGDYHGAVVALSKARAMARARGDTATELETVRNLVHATLRLDGPRSRSLMALEGDLVRLLSEVTDATEHMQAWNTLATVALYRGQSATAIACVDRARHHTAGNPEYEIYTIANEGLAAALGSDASSTGTIQTAVELAYRGDNMLAVRQIRNDLNSIARLAGRPDLANLESQIKWE